MYFILITYIIFNIITYKMFCKNISDEVKTKYKFYFLIPTGLLILKLTRYRFNTNYDFNLMNTFIKLKGKKKAKYYLYIHTAYKLSIIIFILLIGILYSINNTFDISVILFIALTCIAFYISTDKDVNKELEKRKTIILYEMSKFVDKFTLMINAGMTVQNAWMKASSVKDSNNKYLYYEISKINSQIKGGKSFYDALEKFSSELMIPDVSKFISLILQNLKKGNEELSSLLRLYSYECWMTRKTIIKKLAEEASIKMIFPMMILFIIIIIIVMTPALMYLQI